MRLLLHPQATGTSVITASVARTRTSPWPERPRRGPPMLAALPRPGLGHRCCRYLRPVAIRPTLPRVIDLPPSDEVVHERRLSGARHLPLEVHAGPRTLEGVEWGLVGPVASIFRRPGQVRHAHWECSRRRPSRRAGREPLASIKVESGESATRFPRARTPARGE